MGLRKSGPKACEWTITAFLKKVARARLKKSIQNFVKLICLPVCHDRVVVVSEWEYGAHQMRVGSRASVGGWRPHCQSWRGRCLVIYASRRGSESAGGGSERRASEPQRSLFCFGTGYTALALCGALQSEAGWTVHGTFRRKGNEQALRDCGIVPHFCTTSKDRESLVLGEGARKALQGSSAILCTIPPSCIEGGGGATSVDLTANTLLQYLRSESFRGDRLAWLGYISSTGVYGDWQGDWVDESCEPRSENARGKARIAAEEAWSRLGMEEGSNLSNNNSSSSRSEYPVHIFRSGGIYGPLRNVLQSRSKAENVEKRRKETYVSRCHILDLVQVLIESIRKPKPGIYNVVDDCPSTRDAVTRFSLDLLEKVARSAETPSVSSSNSFPHWDLDYAQQQQAKSTRMDAAIDGLPTTGKRVSNQKVKSELGIVLEHPSYVEGMAAIIGGNIRPFSKELLTAYTQGIPK